MQVLGVGGGEQELSLAYYLEERLLQEASGWVQRFTSRCSLQLSPEEGAAERVLAQHRATASSLGRWEIPTRSPLLYPRALPSAGHQFYPLVTPPRTLCWCSEARKADFYQSRISRVTLWGFGQIPQPHKNSSSFSLSWLCHSEAAWSPRSRLSPLWDERCFYRTSENP